MPSSSISLENLIGDMLDGLASQVTLLRVLELMSSSDSGNIILVPI